jgi:hypothetical protein
MNRLRASLFTLAATLIPFSALAATPEHHHGGGNSPSVVTGAYSITYNIDVVSTLPAGATIVCKAQIAPALQGVEGQNGQIVPIESAASIATVSGSTATCVVQIPFAWTLNANQTNVVLNYEIQAVNASATLPVVVRNSVLQGVSEPLPASGATSALTFAVTF